MALIEIEIGQLSPPLQNRGGVNASLVVRVVQLLDPSGGRPKPPSRHELIVAIGGLPVHLDVAPGLWALDLLLPSGEVVTRQTRAEEGKDAKVHFDLGASPREWLAWQYLEGRVPERSHYQRVIDGAGSSLAGAAASGAIGRSADKAAAVRDIFGTPVVETDAFAFADGNGGGALTQVTLLRYTQPAEIEGEPEDKFCHAAERWQTWIKALSFETSILDMPGLVEDSENQFEMAGSDNWQQSWRLAGDDFHAHQRPVAIIATNDSVELASLPLPWIDQMTLEPSEIELAIDKSKAQLSRTSVTLQDPVYFGLLSYLKSGARAVAAQVARTGPAGENMLVDILRSKFANPLAAAAATYALLSAKDLREEQHWHSWIDNLANYFEDIPDGAILAGRFAIASGRRSREDAKRDFLRGFERGLPFYSLGLTWLLEGLRQFSDPEEDKDCIAAADLVRQVALRSDVEQVFTVLRFYAPANFDAETSDA